MFHDFWRCEKGSLDDNSPLRNRCRHQGTVGIIMMVTLRASTIELSLNTKPRAKYFISFHWNPPAVPWSRWYYFPILQTRQPRIREGKWLALGHTARKYYSQNLASDTSDTNVFFFWTTGLSCILKSPPKPTFPFSNFLLITQDSVPTIWQAKNLFPQPPIYSVSGLLPLWRSESRFP